MVLCRHGKLCNRPSKIQLENPHPCLTQKGAQPYCHLFQGWSLLWCSSSSLVQAFKWLMEESLTQIHCVKMTCPEFQILGYFGIRETSKMHTAKYKSWKNCKLQSVIKCAILHHRSKSIILYWYTALSTVIVNSCPN